MSKIKYFLNLVLLVSFFFICQTFPQNNSQSQYQLRRLVYDNSGSEKGITYFDYDDNGLNNVSIWELESGKRFSINFQDYDKNGNLTKKAREYSDHKNTVQLFTYDDKNRVISEEFILQDTSRGITTYEYDSLDQLQLINCKAYLGWINGLIKINYENGRKSSGELFQKEKSVAKISYEYNDSNNLSKETWDFNLGWKQTFIYEYEKIPTKKVTYTSSNAFIINESKNVTKEDYRYSDNLGGPSFYKYNFQGKLTEKIYERSDGFKTNTFYLYDIKGVLIRAFRRFTGDKNALFRFKFNKDRKMTLKEFYMNDKSYGKEEYIYDSDGKLTMAIFTNSDQWLNGKIDITNYNMKVPSKAVYKDKNSFTADITFDYDKEFLLKKIHWDFSFNKQQIYNFSY